MTKKKWMMVTFAVAAVALLVANLLWDTLAGTIAALISLVFALISLWLSYKVE